MHFTLNTSPSTQESMVPTPHIGEELSVHYSTFTFAACVEGCIGYVLQKISKVCWYFLQESGNMMADNNSWLWR